MNHYRKVYEDYLQSPEWKEKREHALNRDEYRCRVCDTRDKLQVHHRTYARLGHEDLNDLTTLCESCHEHFHKKMRQDEIMMRTYAPPLVEETLSPLERERRNAQQWEDFLVGALIQYPELLPHVRGIVSEDDFIGEDAQSLYQVFCAEQTIPPELMDAVARCKASIEDSGLPNSSDRMKSIVMSAMRLRHIHLLRMNTRITTLIQESAASNNRDEVRRLQVQQLDLCQQLRTLTSATKMHG